MRSATRHRHFEKQGYGGWQEVSEAAFDDERRTLDLPLRQTGVAPVGTRVRRSRQLPANRLLCGTDPRISG
jgi:hypothetical protein